MLNLEIWDISDVIVTQMCELPHSTYVYVAKFHPLEEKYVITCANDGAIRIWKTNIDIEGVAQLTQEIFQHKSNINSICFNEMERKMYSADSNGIINVWIFNKDVEFERTILIDEIENISINHIEITNNGRKMMIHCKDNILRLIDLRMNVISIRYFGSVTYSLRNRSCITPCGSFLFAGSQDGKYYVWDVASGDSLVIYNELDYSQGVTDVHFHPHDNIVAFCCHPSSQNIVLYKYVSGLAIENCVYDRVNQSVTNVPRLTYKPSDITNSPPEIKHEYIMSPEPGVLSPHAMCRLKIFDNEKNMSNINYAAQNIYKDSSIFRTLGKAGTLKPHNILSRNALVKLEVQEEKPIKTIIKNIGKTTKYKQAKVLHPYNASRSDEISLKNGDFVQVMYQDTPTWWLGENSNGYQGFFPSNYVSIIDER
ncbi:hypothetical protein A3Q56_03879 [Intoshia linei]|uniref:SH3 domain-containing protein n=1 Tax=Intoshia linei TaxID=1819745 RepID=A0A177B4R9_9BILA|nr:hypothetical protein A3Q56_03879 [Intoshia linei]